MKTSPPPTSAPARVAVVIPGKPESATTAWRRLIRSVDPAKRGSFALEGPFLDPGTAIDLPAGAVVMVVDRYVDRWHIRMTRAAPPWLETVHEWQTKSALGQRIVNYVGRRLHDDAASHTFVRLEAMPNRWPSWCRRCRGPVPAGAGRVTWDGHSVVEHHPGRCPPPPEVITPNRYPGLCFACGGWVAAEAGSAIRLTAPREGTGAMYEPMHGTPDGGQCPDDPIPGPPNQTPGWCADCRELVPAGRGHWLDDRLHHTRACPDERLGVPTWIVRAPGPVRLKPGQVARVQVELDDGDSAVPESAPGWRHLAPNLVGLVAVVVETVDGRTGRQRARVRAATPAEAADVLAAELALLPDARPHTAGFKARWQAEKIGEARPWLAEITGRDVRYGGFDRRFLRANRDYSRANSRGTRGIVYAWTLAVNRIYEANRWTSRKSSRRVFLRTTPEGDVVEITREEVEAWLDHAPPWIAS